MLLGFELGINRLLQLLWILAHDDLIEALDPLVFGILGFCIKTERSFHREQDKDVLPTTLFVFLDLLHLVDAADDIGELNRLLWLFAQLLAIFDQEHALCRVKYEVPQIKATQLEKFLSTHVLIEVAFLGRKRKLVGTTIVYAVVFFDSWVLWYFRQLRYLDLLR